MRIAMLSAVALVALAVTACNSDDEPASYPSSADDTAQIRYVVDQFNQAADDLDGSHLCAEVIAPSARGGSVEECAEPIDGAMTEAPENWGQLTELEAIEVDDESATAEAVQEDAPITLTFTREDDRWWMQVSD